MQKLLSICIPTYNRHLFVSRLIRNLLNFDRSLFQDVDIIVADNCSSDETGDFFQNLLPEKVEFLKYYRNEENIGSTRNLERLIDLATSKYVWWFGDDDWMEEDNLRMVLKHLSSVRAPEVLIIDHSTYHQGNLFIPSLLNHYFHKPLQTTLSEALNTIGPLSSLGFISAVIFRRLASPQYAFDLFYKFKTSHSHVGYLIANFYNESVMYDVDNKIKMNAEHRYAHYEHNENLKDDFFSWQSFSAKVDLMSAVAFGMPLMLDYLMQERKFSVKNLFLGKEYCSETIQRSTLLFMALKYVRNIKTVQNLPGLSFDLQSVKKFYKKYGMPIELMSHLYEFIPGRGKYIAFFKLVIKRVFFVFFNIISRVLMFFVKKRFVSLDYNEK